MKTKIKIVLKILCIPVGLLLFSFGITAAQNTQVTWSTYDMGFAVSSSSANVSTLSAAGQLFVGATSLANTRIETGLFANPGIILSVKEDGEIPVTFMLHQNYPNPFNPTTTIRFALPKMSNVQLEIYNIIGQRVVTLVNEVLEAGYYNETFDAGSLSSGVYFYRLQAEGFTDVKKMMVLK